MSSDGRVFAYHGESPWSDPFYHINWVWWCTPNPSTRKEETKESGSSIWSLGTQSVWGQAGYLPKNKKQKQKSMYSISLSKLPMMNPSNCPKHTVYILCNNILHVLLSLSPAELDWNPSLPACNWRLYPLCFGDPDEDEQKLLQCSSPRSAFFYCSNETSAAFRNTNACVCCGKECKEWNIEKIHNTAGAH